jgi:SAM-dependent methyltransferase
MKSIAHGYGTGSLVGGLLSPLDQVQMFERKYDPLTTEIIKGLPVGREWRCLEVGAGAGSVARWLAGRADRGSVLAVDVDVRYLDAGGAPTMTVRQLDIMQADFAPGSFDLVTARAVFEHLPQRDDLLTRVVEWLVPGGWLVVEDFYYLPTDGAPTSVGRALLDGYVRRLEALGADMQWARCLPSIMTAAGPGQSAADNELITLRLGQEGHSLVERGLVSAAELAEFVEAMRSGDAWDITALEISAWGRRPG